jgi:pimeloyl-ACP methyl ester carboxylesterase
MDESEPTAAVVALRALEAIGDRFADRDAFTGALSDRGLSEPVAAWLALNLERRDGGFELALDLAAIRALLADYFATGTWSTLEGGGVVDVAIAGKGSALDAGDQRRLAELERRGAVRCHRFEDAGHWIHVDDPDGLLEAIAASLG